MTTRVSLLHHPDSLAYTRGNKTYMSHINIAGWSGSSYLTVANVWLEPTTLRLLQFLYMYLKDTINIHTVFPACDNSVHHKECLDITIYLCNYQVGSTQWR